MTSKQTSKNKQNSGAPSEDEQQLHDAPPSKTSQDKEASTAVEAGDQEQIDTLLGLLEGDLTAIDSETALGLIDQWSGSLNKSKDAEVKELARSLKELKQLLKSGKASGHEVGEVLSEVGGQTSNIAADADKELKTPLQKLGKFLAQAGKSLGKAEDQENIEQIDGLVDLLGDDLTAIESETSVGAIDHWYAQLHKSEDETLKAIATDLKHLKQVLKRSNPKATDLAEVLTRLGSQTVEASAQAPRGFKGHIQRLGKTLSQAGKSIEPD